MLRKIFEQTKMIPPNGKSGAYKRLRAALGCSFTFERGLHIGHAGHIDWVTK